MATLEYSYGVSETKGFGGAAPCLKGDSLGTSYSITIGGVSATAGSDTGGSPHPSVNGICKVQAVGAACRVAFAAAPTAAATSTYLADGAVEYFGVEEGQKPAVISA